MPPAAKKSDPDVTGTGLPVTEPSAGEQSLATLKGVVLDPLQLVPLQQRRRPDRGTVRPAGNQLVPSPLVPHSGPRALKAGDPTLPSGNTGNDGLPRAGRRAAQQAA